MKVLISIFLSILLLFACACTKIGEADTPKTEASAEVELAELIEAGDVYVGATYSDAVNCFEDLISEASLVVSCRVEKTEFPSAAAQRSLVSVKDIYKGNAEEHIYVCQIADDNAVKEGGEYILFLNPQTGNEDNNGYYTVGGGIGALELDPANGSIVLWNSSINDEALAGWLSENTGFSDWSVRLP